jgi:hypothetical protein
MGIFVLATMFIDNFKRLAKTIGWLLVCTGKFVWRAPERSVRLLKYLIWRLWCWIRKR